MRSNFIETLSQLTSILGIHGIHALKLRWTYTWNVMSNFILKLSFDIFVRDPGFEVQSWHVRRTGRAVGRSGGMPKQKAKLLSKEKTF